MNIEEFKSIINEELKFRWMDEDEDYVNAYCVLVSKLAKQHRKLLVIECSLESKSVPERRKHERKIRNLEKKIRRHTPFTECSFRGLHREHTVYIKLKSVQTKEPEGMGIPVLMKC